MGKKRSKKKVAAKSSGVVVVVFRKNCTVGTANFRAGKEYEVPANKAAKYKAMRLLV